jgi:ATPase subunit of ABC transporter with duplicated ATPase domains
MHRIRFEKVTFGYTDLLFENVSFSIGFQDRVGIVGNNGTGKSTLLQCIAGLIEPQDGRIFCPKGLRFSFIEQSIPKQLFDRCLYDVISDAIPLEDKNLMAWKVDITLDTFKVTQNIRQKPVKELSGGWQRLALIARTVLSQPDILLFDEPTNHLDISKIMLLEQWLNEQVYDIPLIAVSHDRSFLANCTSKTLFLRCAEVLTYDYSYERAVQLLNEDDNASEAKRAKELKEMNRLRRSAHELRQIGVNNYSTAALKKSSQIAKRAESIETKLTTVHVEEKRSIKLSNGGMLTKQLVELSHVDVIAPDGVLLFNIHQLTILQGERLVIFGPNGCGKSQLLKLIHHSCQDITEARTRGIAITPTIKPGYIDQHMSHLPLKMPLHEYINDALSFGVQKTTSVLVGAGFPISLQRTQLGLLSQGQRSRIAFLALHFIQPNFYIMDEPTNHLDIAGQEQLAFEIVDKGAASIIVSHDRTFTTAVGTKFFMVKGKQLVQIDSPKDYYDEMMTSNVF